jgi:DNA polymerase V
LTPKTSPNDLSICIYEAETSTILEIPMVSSSISAGFPSPALDFIDIRIDLNRHLIKHPSSTYFGRVKGVSMKDAGIDDGDLLIIDRSLEPKNDRIAVCFIEGEFTLKRIRIEKRCCWLIPANPNYEAIQVHADQEFMIWGIVSFIIKKV